MLIDYLTLAESYMYVTCINRYDHYYNLVKQIKGKGSRLKPKY